MTRSSYLDNRTQKCFVNGSLSNTCTLKCGVPQGTILGPLLFLLYINDLPNCLSRSEPRMYVTLGHVFPYMDFVPSWPSICSTSYHDMVFRSEDL